MGNDVELYKEGYSTWLSSRPQNQPRSWSPVYGLLCKFSPNCALSPCLIDVVATICNASHSIMFNMDNGN